MIDIVFPKNNEKEFIKLAENLKIERLCLAYDKITDVSEFQAQTKLKLSSAVICTQDNIKKFKGKAFTIMNSPEDQTKLRHIIEKIRPDILFGLESGAKKDFLHHRASGLNHILATIAAQKNVSIGFGFSSILKAKPWQRSVYIGRMMQNIRFARKFKFKTVIASFADNPWNMRSEHDLISFFITLGMTASEAKAALDWVGR
ncbi:hypothetical protein KY349_00440 [Candidatus Woesearchaeota archaeon]|nr:hypothetical protein [Candidatus Woesearchaeota archaeon]